MNKQPVLNILTDIFQAYKYEIDSSYISDLLVSRANSDRIYIKLDQDIDYNSMRTFADSLKHTDGTGLYILNNIATGEVSDFASRYDLVFWDRHDLEKQIGRAILSNALGETMELNITEYAIDKPLNNVQLPDTDQPQGSSIFEMFNTSVPLDNQPESQKSGHDASINSGTLSKADLLNTEEPLIRIPLPSMSINMAKTSAIKIGEAKIGEIMNFLLKFIPYYSFRYDFESKRKFRSKIIDLNGHGEGTINAITGEERFTRFPQPLEYVEIPTENYHIKEPHISDKKAIEIALDEIIKKHSQKIKLDEVKGDAILYESKTLSPVEKDINITVRLVYIPVWEVRGQNNSIDINAYDGHVIEEPVDDDVEFV